MNFLPIHVIVADDYEVVREGLTAILARDPRVHLVAITEQFHTLVDALDQNHIDVVVLDLKGMGTPPITMVHRLRRSYPDVALVVYSSSIDLAPELLKAGAQGYVAKNEMSDHLLAAVHAVVNGQVFVSPTTQAYLDRARAQRTHLHLTPQELSVLKLHAHGLSTVDIADQLTIDPRTVYLHLTHVREKTGCSRTQLVGWYYRTYGMEEASATP